MRATVALLLLCLCVSCTALTFEDIRDKKVRDYLSSTPSDGSEDSGSCLFGGDPSPMSGTPNACAQYQDNACCTLEEANSVADVVNRIDVACKDYLSDECLTYLVNMYCGLMCDPSMKSFDGICYDYCVEGEKACSLIEYNSNQYYYNCPAVYTNECVPVNDENCWNSAETTHRTVRAVVVGLSLTAMLGML